ncbi:MAG TPA: hypothetical protein VGI70_11835 [Polyangiales bacterium]
MAAPAPKDRQGRLGLVSFDLRDRTLTLTPERWPVRIAAFSGAGFGPPLRAAELTRIRQSGADLVLLLGGLGDDDASAVNNAKSLASLGRLVITLLGGRDRMAVAAAAFDAAGQGIIDATPLSRVRVAANTLVPVAGAEQGRYALDEHACGFAPRDLDALARDLGARSAGERRWLLSWHAPAGGPAQLGSRRLAEFAEHIGALGALSAWPVGQAESPTEGALGALLVPRLFGPRPEQPDGSRRELGLSLIEADREGLRLLAGR